MIRLLLALFITLTISDNSMAYPQFIGKGYHACLTCHYNPFGNGPLNDYGRGVAATGLAGRFLIPDSVSDQTLGERSSIIFGNPDKLPIKPSLDYRGIQIKRGLEQDESNDLWINMQLELSLSANWGKRKEYVVNVSRNTLVGNNPLSGGGRRALGSKIDGDLSYIREAYIGYRVTQELGVYLGKMDKVYGIRIADHNLYSRKNTKNNFNSSTPGIMFHYGTQDYDAGLMLHKDQEIEEDNEKSSDPTQGFSGKFEYSFNKRWRLGFSHINEVEVEDDERKFNATALILKTRVGEGSSIMAEVGATSTTNAAGTTDGQYIFLQSHMYLARGLYYVTTYEMEATDTSKYDETHRLGPGIQWFPLQRFELRADLLNAKNYKTDQSNRDTWEFLGQVHLWF